MTCSCGCNKVEDFGNETFCTSCGSLVEQDMIVTPKPNKWDKYQHQRYGAGSDVSHKFLGNRIFCNSKQTYWIRQRNSKRRDLVTLCKKLKLPCPELVAETALSMLEKHVYKPRKHTTKRHRAAAIYASCKMHSVQITASDIVTGLELQGKHLSTFFLKFYKQCTNNHDDTSRTDSHTKPGLADFLDMEGNGVIPPNTAHTYYQLCSDISDLFPVTEDSCVRKGGQSSFFRRDARHRLAVFLSMAYLHLNGEELESSKLELVGVMPNRLITFERDLGSCWTTLHKTCLLFMSWILCNSRKNASRREFSKFLGKLLDRKVKCLLIENLKKYREFGDVRPGRTKVEKPDQPAKKPYNRKEKHHHHPAALLSSSQTGVSIIDTTTLNQCLEVFSNQGFLQNSTSTLQLFERLLSILYLTDMRSLLQKMPKLIYFVLLYQIITNTECSVPPLTQLLNDNKADKVDEMIRKMLIKTFVKYTPEMLPTNLDLRKLTATIHTYYNAIVNPVQSYKKLINHISADTLTETSSFSSYSSSSSSSSSSTLSSTMSTSSSFSTPSSPSHPPQQSDALYVVPPELTVALMTQL